MATAMTKPTKAKIVAGIKAHLASNYPGCKIESGKGGYFVQIDPNDQQADFFITVQDKSDLSKLVSKEAARQQAAQEKARKAQLAKIERERKARLKAAEKARSARKK